MPCLNKSHDLKGYKLLAVVELDWFGSSFLPRVRRLGYTVKASEKSISAAFPVKKSFKPRFFISRIRDLVDGFTFKIRLMTSLATRDAN